MATLPALAMVWRRHRRQTPLDKPKESVGRHREESGRINRDLFPRVRVPFVLHDARNEGEEREVTAGADVFPGVDRRTHLPDEDGTCGDGRAGVHLHSALLCA